MKILVDGDGSFTTRGTIRDDHPVPTTSASKLVSNAHTSDVTMGRCAKVGGQVEPHAARMGDYFNVGAVTKAYRALGTYAPVRLRRLLRIKHKVRRRI